MEHPDTPFLKWALFYRHTCPSGRCRGNDSFATLAQARSASACDKILMIFSPALAGGARVAFFAKLGGLGGELLTLRKSCDKAGVRVAEKERFGQLMESKSGARRKACPALGSNG